MKYKNRNFSDFEEFIFHVVNRLEADNGLFVTAIAKFDDMKKVLKEIMFYEAVNFESLCIECPEMSGYTDEFVMSFWTDGENIEIGCEPLKTENEYGNPCGDVVYIFGDCSSKIIKMCDGSELYYVEIGDECDCDEECDCEGCGQCGRSQSVKAGDKFNTKDVEEFVPKHRSDFYKEIAIFKKLLDF